MAVERSSAAIEGLDAAIATLRGLPDKLRKRALRNALAAGARIVRDAAKRATPVLSASDPAVRKGWRKPGTLKKAITVRTSKAARRAGNVGVFVNVRPAKGAKFSGGKQVRASQRGAKNPNDPFYWRFVNWDINPAGFDRSKEGKAERRRLNKAGAAKQRQGVRFLEAGAAKLGAAFDAFKQAMRPVLAKINANPKSNP
jgi:HK97 gp10 family phage protein